MNKLIFAAATFIAFIFYASSCKKKNVTPVNSEVKAHYYYKPGSYWVYIDTVSGRYDSFSVEKARDFTYEESSIKSYEVIEITIMDRTNGTNNLEVSLYDRRNITFRFAIGVNVIPTGFTYPLYIGSSQFVKYFYSVKNINGINYNNVINTFENNGNFFINDSVGLIRADLFDSNNSVNISWRLVRCKIVI
jgi:hypothetical protein